MKSAIKYVVGKTYKPFLVKYLSRTRSYSYQGIHLQIPAGVFHPGYFHSTKLLLRSISALSLQNKTFLEPGAGSGLISFYAAKQGAVVTATDINPIAVKYLQKARQLNQVKAEIVLSDLFDDIPPKAFDIIAINPPYYKRDPVTQDDHAWYCGVNGEYFEKLFGSLGEYSHTGTVIYMVLCDGCDLDMIHSIARNYHFKMDLLVKKRTLLEENFIFKIVREEK